ncbi:MAG: (deoxy)nucleoside triphosphate pyrophosphohydrolase [Mycobacterium sp.]|nr:(deoxy)nucleoside triphosphate pyrophosphohydrolase [Mycobacterium sp.]
MQIVVAGALIADGALLVAQRGRPPELAGLWELPGGKVAPGETEPQALARELLEELGVEVEVGARLGADVVAGAVILRAYQVTLVGGELHPHDHTALRWVRAAGLGELAWVPADRAWLPELHDRLSQ